MSKNVKKLLSWLSAAAMVLAMVPAVALPAAAEETEAAPEIQYGAANLPEGTQEIMDAAAAIQDADLEAHIEAGTCPICGTVEGGWIEATYPKESKTENDVRHYYVKDSTEVQKKYNWYAANAKNITMCLALLNTNAKEIGGMIGLRNGANGCTLNIMGSGTITSDGTSTNDGQFGTICVQGSNNTVNLYGGTFIYTGDGQGRTKIDSNGDGVVDSNDKTYEPSGKPSAAALTIKGTGNGNVVNMFDDVTIGPETEDNTKACYNVLMQLGKENLSNTFNMYGGTIRNGVSNMPNAGANLNMYYVSTMQKTKPAFNMYGGTITGGTYVEGTKNSHGGSIYCGAGSQVSIYGGTITGGKTTGYGGNLYALDSGVTRIKFFGGIMENGEASYGGNIYTTAPVTVDGTAWIRDGVATSSSGGNIAFRGAARTSTIMGGKISGGEAEMGSGGNIYATNKLTIEGGLIADGQARTGGNVSLQGAINTISGGIIENGVATAGAGGGNVYASANDDIDGDEVVNITGGIIRGGKTTHAEGCGGNIRVADNVLNIGGTAQIQDGETNHMGGNLYITGGSVATIDGNAVLSGGVCNSDGGNVTLYNGKLTIGGNAQLKDGKATNYVVTVTEEGKEKESKVGVGGNLFVYSYNTKDENENKIYTNEIRIQDNVVISGGWANQGGNVNIDASAVAEIASTVTIKDGVAGIEVDGEMTLDDGINNAGRGGNVYHSLGTLNIGATLSGGQALYGGNLAQYGGTVNFSGIMENGHTKAFGGNACVQGSSTVLNLNNAQLRNATSDGQGGNIRVYSSTVNMNGGVISGGDDLSKNNTDNVWLVRGTLNMSGDATVQGYNIYGSAVRAVPYSGVPSVVSLADTASITGETANVLTVQKNDNGDQSILYIVEGWAGTATAATESTYNYGDTIPDNIMVVGSFNEEGAFVKGGTYTGTLTNNNVNVYGVEGDVVVAAAGYFADDDTKTWFQTNEEAIAAYQHSETAYVLLTGETAQIPETISEINIRLSGKDVTVSGKATVYGSDKGNDDYDGAAKLIPAEGAELDVQPVACMASGRRYIALQGEDGSWTFHRLTMYMDTVTLRTEGNPGIYYKATYKCDEILKDYVETYGVALSLQDVPGADFAAEDKYTEYGAEAFAAAYEKNTVNTVSGAVVGILKERNSKETNTANAARKIYANAYLKLDIGGEELVIMADGNNIGKNAEAEEFNGTGYSLMDVLGGVNENWDNYSDEDKVVVKGFLEKWAAFITDEAVATLQTALNKIFG